jgi:hypothetical protein
MMAIAKRYSGTTPDPLDPEKTLPKIDLYEAWNEPNYKEFLTPQFDGAGAAGKLTVVETYRTLLNSMYSGVKAIQPNATVLSAGLGPYGSSSNGREIEPQKFLQILVCLHRVHYSFETLRCPVRACLDGVAHHPYTFFGTALTQSATNFGAGLGDTPELIKTIKVAAARRLVLPIGPKPFWVTEFGWITDPPGRGVLGTKRRIGIAPKLAGEYAAETVYRLWHWGAEAAVWEYIGDSDKWPGGLYFRNSDDTYTVPKPSLRGLRFPIFPLAQGPNIKVWAMTPCSGVDSTVRIQFAARGRWQPATTVVPDSQQMVNVVLPKLPGTTRVRAFTNSLGCSDSSVSMPVYRK